MPKAFGPDLRQGYGQSESIGMGTALRKDDHDPALRGGWFRTSHLAVRDASGFWHLVDRKNDMILSVGFDVYPREIDDVLTGTSRSPRPLSSECWPRSAARPSPRSSWARVEVEVDVDALTVLVRDRKGPHQARKRVETVPELPATGNGKIDKRHSARRSGRNVH